jgi:hypothetical protein
MPEQNAQVSPLSEVDNYRRRRTPALHSINHTESSANQPTARSRLKSPFA